MTSVQLKELAAPSGLVGGPFGSSLVSADYRDAGVPVIRGENLNAGKWVGGPFVYVSEEKVRADLARNTARAGDVVFTQRGTLGQVAIVPGGAADELVVSQSQMRLRVDRSKALPEFVYYACSEARFLQQISDRAIATGVPHINLGILASLEVPFPPLPTQRAIAEVLGALDDKIAANGTVCDSASGLMSGLIAKMATDFDAVSLADLAASVKVQVAPTEMGEVAHYSLPAFDDGRGPALDSGATIMSAKLQMRQPCVLLSRLNPRIPRVWDVPQLPDRPAVASTEFLMLVPRGISTGALWAVLSQPSVLVRLQELARGTSGSHQRVKPEDAMRLEVPDARKLSDAQVTVLGDLSLRRHAAGLESIVLASMRDTILPHLMSGRITVREAEKAVGEVL